MKKGIVFIIFLLLAFMVSISVEKKIQITMLVENPLKIHEGEFYYENEKGRYVSVPVNYRDNLVKITINDANHISSLRFDPMDGRGYIIIKKIFVNGQEVDLKKLDPSPLHSIKSIDLEKDGLKIVSKGRDPYLLLLKDIDQKYVFKNFNLKLFLSLVLLMIVYKKLNVEKYNTLTIKKYMFIYLLFFTISSLITAWYLLEISNIHASLAAKLFFFDRFIDEFVIVLLSVLLFISKVKPLFFVGALFFTTYISLWFSQLVSLAISGRFLTKLAVENVEFIGLMINYENVSIILIMFFVLIVLPFVFTYFVIKKTQIKLNTKILLPIVLIVETLVHINRHYLDKNTLDDKKHLFYATKLHHTAPVQAFVNIYKNKKGEKIVFSKIDIENIQKFGFPLNLDARYPLMKESIYKKDLQLQWAKKPNVIVIFTEGTSARTIGVYNKKFKDLTPNMDLFANDENTMIVRNYYNHTAATYRGLHGQLCSLYPKYGGVGGWHDNIDKMPVVDYKCLPHILNHNNYDTIYLNMHYKNASSNEEMVAHFGFNDIESADTLGPKYIQNFKKTRGDFLKDQESYEVLINYLKKHKESQKPFFLAMYTVQTHAWVDTDSNGIKFGDGKINGLNTIYNLDSAFGKFWKYFKNSRYYNDTIIVFTADHAHYYEKSFVKIMKKYNEQSYQKIFVDKIPLLIYMPQKFKKEYDAHNNTSIALAPTIVQLLGIPNERNSFVGVSIFEHKTNIGFASFGSSHYLISDSGIDDSFTVKKENLPLYKSLKKYVKYMHELEEQNRIYKR